MQGAARRIPADSSYRSPSSPSPQSHTTISLLATATPAALFCQRLGKARRRAPIARPATVRGRVSGRIWSIGTWIAAVRAGGRARAWAVRTGRAREPRAPGRSPHTRAPLQTAQPPHRATFLTRRACGAGRALRRKEVADSSHDRPSQRGATVTWSSGPAAPPGSSAGKPPDPSSVHCPRRSVADAAGRTMNYKPVH